MASSLLGGSLACVQLLSADADSSWQTIVKDAAQYATLHVLLTNILVENRPKPKFFLNLGF